MTQALIVLGIFILAVVAIQYWLVSVSLEDWLDTDDEVEPMEGGVKEGSHPIVDNVDDVDWKKLSDNQEI